MNNVFDVASEIRTNTGAKILRKISLEKMHYHLMDLFQDRTKIDEQVNLLDNEDGIRQTLRYIHCKNLNDERTIKFHQGWKQESDVFDEKRQIWIDSFIDPINDDLFIPRSDAK